MYVAELSAGFDFSFNSTFK